MITNIISRWVAWSGGLMLVLALLVRLTTRDAFPLSAALFYATPPAVLAFGSGVVAVAWLLASRPWRACFSAVAMLAAAGWWWHSAVVVNQSTPTDDALPVMFWNAGRGEEEDILATIRAYEADIVGLTEVRGLRDPALRRWERKLPGYSLTNVHSGLILLARGEITDDQSGPLGKHGRFRRLRVTTRQGPLEVLLVDFHSDPLRPRREPMGELQQLVQQVEGPLLVMGDFNTPHDSMHWKLLTPPLQNAFRTRGSGYAPTWPLPVPVLQLDYIWTNPQLEVIASRTGWESSSDHRPVLAWIRLPAAAKAATAAR